MTLRLRPLAILAAALALVAGVPAVGAAADPTAATPSATEPPGGSARRTAPVITPTPQDLQERDDRATITPTMTVDAGAKATPPRWK